MKIVEFDISNVPFNDKEISLCLGYFDGVHLGHQAIIKESMNEGYPVGVLSFDNSPSYILGQKGNYELTSIADKADLFEELGVKYLFIMHFDKSTLNVTKDEFIKDVLMKLNVKKVFCGEDYRFGTRGEGNPDYLKRFFDVTVIPTIKIGEDKVSSSAIRELISAGNIKMANRYLGRPYRLIGLVSYGLKKGRTLGFPTANLDLDANYVFPKEGVYMGYAYINNRKKKALICVSTHPTINQLLDPIVEVHIVDFDENIYGLTISVDFIDYIRDIFEFGTTDDLIEQIKKDLEKVKNTLQ